MYFTRVEESGDLKMPRRFTHRPVKVTCIEVFGVPIIGIVLAASWVSLAGIVAPPSLSLRTH